MPSYRSDRALTVIDITQFPKIGNMAAGGGLAGIFDGSVSTAGRREAMTGWAGVDFSSSPKRIERVEVTPPANGFDASGLTTSITLALRAKNGAPPVDQSDGVLLGSMTFTDVNAQTMRVLNSSDKLTQFSFVWVSVTTGVWSTFADMRFFAAAERTAPVPPQATVAVHQKACNDGFALPWNNVEVPGFAFDIAVDTPGVALIDFSVNLTHVGDTFSPQYLGPIGVGAQFVYKFSENFDGLDAAPWLTPGNSRTNGINIDDRDPAHYANVSLQTSMSVVPGFYRLTLRMSAHTTGDSRDGLARILAEGGKGLNGLRVTVIKGASFYDMSN